jgi:Tol biopolymer transport system component
MSRGAFVRGLVSLVALVVCALSGAGAAHAGASQPAVVFARLNGFGANENYEIWTMRVDGTHQTRLTNNDHADQEPVWSPDGAWIAWDRFRDQFNVGLSNVWLMRADGSDKHALTRDHAFVTHPTWSPDGTRIAFSLNDQIAIIDADGTAQHVISPAGAFDVDPAWSHAGNRISFLRLSGPGAARVMTMRPDGSGGRVVHRLPYYRFSSEIGTAWSPDDAWIAFAADSRIHSWGVYLVRRDGTELHRLVPQYSLYPTFTPDGARLAFYACAVANCGLYTAFADGSGFAPLGRIRRYSDVEPDWSRADP